ncbi:hypothetical protein [Curtobacterium sp. MCBD17_028]|uniref:hypothetical protein n=1 Tax=Curtobacterium sp. MCBD17_028 TaxID=2175670 RepID=UPI000DA730E3|nr:hypothetical protein [Curtobacterium sp. MCBD17_028]PZE27145.1 hypothetical protein DEI86_06440 [Curtobacterium sp. MCBD17_028]
MNDVYAVVGGREYRLDVVADGRQLDSLVNDPGVKHVDLDGGGTLVYQGEPGCPVVIVQRPQSRSTADVHR